jgi:hypothetical protein
VSFEACIVEMGVFATILAIGSGEGVGSFDREIRLPETSLRVANRRAGGIVRRVIGGLRNEAWEVPSGLLAGGKDDGNHHAAIRACVASCSGG